jgi:hypothetical protein
MNFFNKYLMNRESFSEVRVIFIQIITTVCFLTLGLLLPTLNLIIFPSSYSEAFWINNEISVRLKYSSLFFIAGITSAILGTEIRNYRRFLKPNDTIYGWKLAVTNDMFILSAIFLLVTSTWLYMRLLLEQYDQLVVEFSRYLDLLYPFAFLFGLIIVSEFKIRWKN